MQEIILQYQIINEIIKQCGRSTISDFASDFNTNKEAYTNYLKNEIRTNVLAQYQGSESVYDAIVSQIITPAVVIEAPRVEPTSNYTYEQLDALEKPELYSILIQLDANTSLKESSAKANIIDAILNFNK